MSRIFFYILLSVVFITCKEVYNPSLVSPATGYLVVDGFINSNGASTIILSRTTKLEDSVNIAYEHGASVYIESDNNESYPLHEGVNGTYTSDFFLLNANNKYRLHISTGNNEYTSDYIAVKHTPPIDSISWIKDNGGVRIYVNAHDDQNQIKYYRWTYSETWEIHSAFVSHLDFVRDPLTNQPIDVTVRSPQNTDSLYKCWKSQNSENILLGSSEKLSSDRIYLPLRFIESNAEELSVLYYIEMKQYAISKEAYIFYQQLKKNTEQLGSIFDAQPSELNGNIHCVSNPLQQVIGYIDVSEQQANSIFISNGQVTPWFLLSGCSATTVVNVPDSMLPIQNSHLPIDVVLRIGPNIIKFSAAPNPCVDCTYRGTNTKPSFWP